MILTKLVMLNTNLRHCGFRSAGFWRGCLIRPALFIFEWKRLPTLDVNRMRIGWTLKIVKGIEHHKGLAVFGDVVTFTVRATRRHRHHLDRRIWLHLPDVTTQITWIGSIYTLTRCILGFGSTSNPGCFLFLVKIGLILESVFGRVWQSAFRIY